MPNLKLTDIPIELQAHILRSLCTPPLSYSRTPSTYTLSSPTWAVEDFPDGMLRAAQSSTTLAKAVVYALGAHAKFLSFRRSKRLSEWIPILKEHVKSVSFTGTAVLNHCECEELMCQCDNLHKGILETLKALYHNDVALVVLNLEELRMTEVSRAEEIAEHTTKAIQRSSPSLKEIAMNVNKTSAIAISRVTLSNLEVVRITSEEYQGDGPAAVSDQLNAAKICGDILQGISGHADRPTNISTVRELRLQNIQKAPIVDRISCASLLLAVKNLTIMCGKASKHSEIAKFISNFRNLETLHWSTGLICPECMDAIFAGCPNLENLELSVKDRRILPGNIDLAHNSSRLKDLFVSLRGKQQKLEFLSYLSPEQIKILGENSPDLTNLEMQIDSKNVGAFSLLLGTHCRKLDELLLLYNVEAIESLGTNGWPALAQAIRSASDKLSTFVLVGHPTGAIIESATDEMVESIIDILEFMGDRASYIQFMVPINTQDPFIVLEALQRTLKAARTHCGTINDLYLDFIQDPSLRNYMVDDSREEKLMDAFQAVYGLQEALALNSSKYPKYVSLGDIDALWERAGEMEDDEEDWEDWENGENGENEEDEEGEEDLDQDVFEA